MSVLDEVMEMEDRLRQAELGPDPDFFELVLADEAVLDGQRLKSKVVEARRPGSGTGQKFSRVEMSDFNIVEYGTAAVVTCAGAYEGAHGTFTLKFMRVWLKREGNWQIIAAATLA